MQRQRYVRWYLQWHTDVQRQRLPWYSNTDPDRFGSPSDFSISAAPGSNSVAAGDDDAANDGIRRYAASDRATAYLCRSYTPTGNLSHPLLAIGRGSVSYTVTLMPVAGFTGTVQLACTGAPSEATCTFSKSSVTLDGSSSVAVAVTVATTAPTVAALPSPPLPKTAFPASLLWACIGFASVAGLLLTKRRRLDAIAAVAVLAWMLVSCGGGTTSGTTGGNGGSMPSTPQGTYSLSVSGADGSLVHTTTISLTVQ
jgi:hypothetical protein